MQFSNAVAHLKLDRRQFFGLLSEWATCGLFSGFGMNASATKRCIEVLLDLPLFFSTTIGYPKVPFPGRIGCHRWDSFPAFVLQDMRFPRLLILYPGHPSTSFQISSSISSSKKRRPAGDSNGTPLFCRLAPAGSVWCGYHLARMYSTQNSSTVFQMAEHVVRARANHNSADFFFRPFTGFYALVNLVYQVPAFIVSLDS